VPSPLWHGSTRLDPTRLALTIGTPLAPQNLTLDRPATASSAEINVMAND
jgi:hypothetical protein